MAVALLAALVSLPSLTAPFQWDDWGLIAGNPIVQDFNYFVHPSAAEGLKWHGAFVNRYVSYLTFALNYSIHGANVFGYHAANLAIHILAAWALYWMVFLLFQTPRMSGGRLEGQWVALWAALIFTAHPLATEAVTYVFQRHASLVALFYITSAALYLRWRLGGGWLCYAGSIAVALLAMKTKENAFTLPVAIALAEAVFFDGEWKRRVLYLSPLMLAMLVVPLTLSGTEGGIGAVVDVAREQARAGSAEYAMIQPRVLVTYLRLFLLPVNQNIDYDYPADVPIVLPLLILAALLALGVWLMIKGREEAALAGYGIAWFFVAHAVESSVVALPMLIDEYRMYLPAAGLIIASVITMGRAIEDRTLLQRAMTAIVIMLALLTLMRNELWRGGAALWEDAATKSPSKARPLYNLGAFEEQSGLNDKARAHYEAALRLDPNHANAHYNLGLLLERAGEYQPAAAHYLRAMELDPADSRALNNLGVVYQKLGLFDDAIKAYQKSAALDENRFESRMNLGAVLLAMGRNEEAARELERASALDPTNIAVHAQLGLAYFRAGDFKNARAHYLRVVELSPRSPDALMDLGAVSMRIGELAQALNYFHNASSLEPARARSWMAMAGVYELMKRPSEALSAYTKALELEPQSAEAHFKLGAFHDSRGETALAEKSFRQAVRLDPRHANALNNLGAILSARGADDEAAGLFERAVKADPSHADAHNNLGVALYRRGEHRKAYEEFRRAVELSSGNADFEHNLKTMEEVLGIRKAVR